MSDGPCCPRPLLAASSLAAGGSSPGMMTKDWPLADVISQSSTCTNLLLADILGNPLTESPTMLAGLAGHGASWLLAW